MKKKLVTMFLAVALTVSMLSGCGGSKAEESTPVSAPAETKSEEKADEPIKEEPKEEADSNNVSDASFTLLDVDEDMIDVGAYGISPDGLELVFSMFTAPDNNRYVSLFGFDNNSDGGSVICGQYEASTETDEDGDEWTYFDVSDVYSGENFQLGVCERPETEEIFFFDENGEVIEGKFLTNAETINYMGTAAGLLMNGGAGNAGDSSAEGGDAETASDISYVDGYYANSGSDDFMIFFYESSDGDVAYVNDGTNEAFAEYTVENAELDDGTPFLLVTVGNIQLGYISDGSDTYIVTEDGTAYAAESLTEAEAEELHSIVTQ